MGGGASVGAGAEAGVGAGELRALPRASHVNADRLAPMLSRLQL